MNHGRGREGKEGRCLFLIKERFTVKLGWKIDNTAHNKSIIVYCILEYSTNFAQVIWK
jgi:hypothetical protein